MSARLKALVLALCLTLTTLLGAIGCGEETAPTWGGPYEEFAIESLLESSEPFKAFYEAERGTILAPVVWYLEPSFLDPQGNPTSALAFTSFVNTPDTIISHHSIYLPRIPAEPEDDFMVAHELRTFVLDHEGFPSLFPTTLTTEPPQERDYYIAIWLNDMVLTPLRDKGLIQYGFDPAQYYNEIIAQLEEDIESGAASAAPIEDWRSWNTVTCYVMWTLYEDMLQRTESGPLQRWCDTAHPLIAERAQELLSIVRQHDYETTEGMRALFAEIIEKYDLNISISTPE